MMHDVGQSVLHASIKSVKSSGVSKLRIRGLNFSTQMSNALAWIGIVHFSINVQRTLTSLGYHSGGHGIGQHLRSSLEIMPRLQWIFMGWAPLSG